MRVDPIYTQEQEKGEREIGESGEMGRQSWNPISNSISIFNKVIKKYPKNTMCILQKRT